MHDRVVDTIRMQPREIHVDCRGDGNVDNFMQITFTILLFT